MKNIEIVFILDKSGSMAHLVGDTIGGFNGFIESQKALDGKVLLTTILFDTTWKILHDGIDIHEVKPMTTTDYSAYGGTAMLDAIGEVINRVQDRHDELGENKPDNVLFVITTDGEENSSCKFTKTQIEKMIKHQTNGHGWNFMFLGANMDAVKEATSIGISQANTISYTWNSQGTDALYRSISDIVTTAKTCNVSLDDLNLQSVYDTCMTNISTAYSADCKITNNN